MAFSAFPASRVATDKPVPSPAHDDLGKIASDSEEKSTPFTSSGCEEYQHGENREPAAEIATSPDGLNKIPSMFGETKKRPTPRSEVQNLRSTLLAGTSASDEARRGSPDRPDRAIRLYSSIIRGR